MTKTNRIDSKVKHPHSENKGPQRQDDDFAPTSCGKSADHEDDQNKECSDGFYATAAGEGE